MAGFEDLIRGALEKQGDPTPDRREAIYNSSRQALERMLSQSSTLNADAVQVQRQRLETAIAQIEASYPAVATPPPLVAPAPQAPEPRPNPAAPPPPTAPAAVKPPQPVAPPVAAPPTRPVTTPKAAPAPAAPVVRREPAFEPAPKPTPAAPPPAAPPPSTPPPSTPLPSQLEPDTGMEDRSAADGDLPQVYRGDALRERKPYAKMLLWAIILVGIGMSIWWAINFGPDLIKQKLGGSVPNPSQSIESGSFLPPAGEGWVTAFEPSENSGNIDASGRGTADLFQGENRTYVRLASNEGSSRNTVRIKLPRGVILPLKGKAATFEIILKNATETPHQFALFCEFASMGSCGRKRFKANKQIEAFIFDVLVNDVELPENEDAYISFNTDLAGTGRALDLYTIRVRAGG